MGSKSAILVFAKDDPRDIFRVSAAADSVESKRLVEDLVGGSVRYVGGGSLDDSIWPAEGTACGGSFNGFDVVCSRDLATYFPSGLTEKVIRCAKGRPAFAVFMHSMEDWAAFACWSESGELIRSVSVNPEKGVMESVGDPLGFEQEFWAGGRRVSHIGSYPLLFHPIDLGNEALRHFFSFVLEGEEDADSIDIEEFSLLAFSLT
ncbi:hypothetical protein JOF53_007479 [Crossiella equi]|uniref:Uncharacterized protein n=1 Tax=Crossiella equi TaxID=130796 RepID=A0ABS5AQU1_9PSEU|nr:hypothetical protein [Crossiella equi]MBP2478607.1 hypothetical protein [Crossiella equi]